MASELLLVNPRRKRRARRAMSALQRQYFSKNPKRRHRHKRRRTVLARNPVAVRRSSRRGHRFNAGGGALSLKNITGQLGPAVVGASGALAIDWIFGTIPLPAFLTTGMMLPITRIGLAIGVGVAAGMVAGKSTGEKVAAGALVVTSYSIIKNFLQTNVPSLTLARFVAHGGQRLRGLGYGGPARIADRSAGHIGLPIPSVAGGGTMGRFVVNRGR